MPKRARVARVIRVFVSSPGDCGTERERIQSVLDAVSSSDSAKEHLLRLEAITWENMPGGQGRTGDTQFVIRRQQRRLGLREYEIYLGFMKERVGTPTPRAASGTIEEWQDAVRMHRWRGRPSEVLFYFIGTSTGGVLEFRQELEARSFLYHAATDTDSFLELVRSHLQSIVDNWRAWPRRLRRTRRALPQVAVGVLALAVTSALFAYLVLDRGGLQAVRAAAAREASAALDAWSARRAYLLFHRESARLVVRDSTFEAVERATRNQSSSTAAGLLERAISGGVITRSERGNAPLLEHLAAQRLFEALLVEAGSATSWDELGLTEFEQSVLSKHATWVVRSHDFHRTGTLESRRSLAELSGDANVLRGLASEALRPSDERADCPEIAAFVARAPIPDVAQWIGGAVAPELAGYRYQDITAAVSRRSDPVLAVELLDLQLAKRTPLDFLDNATVTLFGVPHDNEDVRSAITKRFLAWIHTQLPDANTLEITLPYVDVAAFDETQREMATDRLLRWLNASERGASDVGAELVAQDLLARMCTARARDVLGRELAGYLADRTSYGIGARIMLIRNMECASPDPVSDRLALAKATGLAASRAISASVTTDFDDTNVQAQFLRSALVAIVERWRAHVRYLQQLLQRRTESVAPVVESGLALLAAPLRRRDYREFDAAFSDLVARLTPAELAELFALPKSDNRVAEFDGTIDRVSYLLDRLVDAHAAAPAEVVTWVFSPHYFEPQVQKAIDSAVAVVGRVDASKILKNRIATSAPSSWRLFALNGDIDSLKWVFDHTQMETLAELLEAIQPLSEAQQQELVRLGIEKYRADSKALKLLLMPASRLGIADPSLISAATSCLAARDVQPKAAALAYLSSVQGGLAHAFQDTAAVAGLRETLATADAFDWGSVVQALTLPLGHDVPEKVFDVLGDRAVLVAAEAQGAGAGMRVGRQRVWTPVLGDLGNRAPERSWQLLQSLFEKRMQVVGAETLPGREAVFGAYCIWLGAEAIRSMSIPKRPDIPDFVWQGLVEGDPVSSRAASIWLVAWTTPRAQ